jgi:hypothetical protein
MDVSDCAGVRRELTRMEVEELRRREETGGGPVTRAGWEKLRGLIEDRRLGLDKVTGSLKVLGSSDGIGPDVIEVSGSDWLREEEGDIDVSEERCSIEIDRESIRSDRSRKFSFLDRIEDDKREPELDSKIVDKRKNGGLEEETVRLRTLTGGEKWDRREEAVKADSRWQRVVVESGYAGEEVIETERIERLVLPESYKLGLEKKGAELNNSDRPTNNFGVGRMPLFPVGAGEEGRNWISSFHKGGCIACVGESGERLHQGRNGKPVILIVGDEAVPMTCGVTVEMEKEACCWILKKEHLGLEEVGGMLRRINCGKQDSDRRKGIRPHDFFLPAGSKVLVSSYVHLRHGGLAKYIEDFAKMVRDVWGVTGDAGVEVLPVAPVVYDGLDELGRELIAGLCDWIGWIGRKAGRDSIVQLAATGGGDREESVCGRVVYAPMAVVQKPKGGGVGGWRVTSGRGMELTVISDKNREVEIRRVLPSTELGRMEEGQGEAGDGEEERECREGFGNGVSMEAEFAFTKAVGEYCREAVREGSYRGNYVLNIKEQMEQRVRRESRDSGKVRVMVIGGSQMRRIGREMVRVGGTVIRDLRVIPVYGQLDEAEMGRVIERVKAEEGRFDRIVVGGPSNSVLVHGREGERGHRPERSVVAVRGEKGEVMCLKTRYHMTEPTRITMSERRRLVDRVIDMIGKVREVTGVRETCYVTMYPRHLTRCCGRVGHMTEGDCMTASSIRRDVDADIVEELREKDWGVRIVEWWATLKLNGEGTTRDLDGLGILCEDGVHLQHRRVNVAAVHLCEVLMVVEEEEDSERGSFTSSKRLRRE